MGSALSSLQLAAPFCHVLEEWAGTPPVQEALQATIANHDVDSLWHLINEDLNLAGKRHFLQERRELSNCKSERTAVLDASRVRARATMIATL
eukprot:8285317-Heterocapsa_arctica.AAC.1